MSLAEAWQGTLKVRQRFGWRAAGLHLTHHLVNRIVFFDRLDVILLARSDLRALPAGQSARFSSHLATRDELLALHADPSWEIKEDKLRLFDRGDQCVLSLIDGQPAGYTWVHAQGAPELVPGLTLQVPGDYLYNYAGFTLPAFRGAGLQSVRHHSVLGQETWSDRSGLLGYVRYVNFSSKKGQDKSGYRKIGSIWLFGTQRHYGARLSRSLHKLGISRVAKAGDADAAPVHTDPRTNRA